MNNKRKYEAFCQKTYVPIYSRPWWMNAICGEENWDVWLYEKGTDVWAAMPYYIENRKNYRYITKPPLTQNNGIIFMYPSGIKAITKQSFEENIINNACKYINKIGIDVYEQQFHYSFNNWLPFFWNKYGEITRYTYVIEDTNDLEKIWNKVSSNYRNKIRKGQKNGIFCRGMNCDLFYNEHRKIFEKQGLQCPFSLNLWKRLYQSCVSNNSGEIFYAKNQEGEIASLMFLVWDEVSVYQILGGSIPAYQNLETYNALIWEGIKFASQNHLKYDFEGSVIKRISKSFREFGGIPMPYFRIRKVFNSEILRDEMEQKIAEIEG